MVEVKGRRDKVGGRKSIEAGTSAACDGARRATEVCYQGSDHCSYLESSPPERHESSCLFRSAPQTVEVPAGWAGTFAGGFQAKVTSGLHVSRAAHGTADAPAPATNNPTNQ